ncbi:amino acid permease [Mycoplasmopsis verecunda]|uniref:Amino acid transporter n=1 Tax=Mycoplasmopsis verecunda TaxID=171291 RepID=A0A1T4LAK9_9BACT|nr:APC family permease [Mycoplasmopsis verecunda]WPB54802.1 APC family permease [Mycoplasmopsis verecunda]SJZ51785.1 Amino acid transporter [Mycoplasmopsis verecunda]
MQKQFTEKSFTFFTINFVIGVGFITTVSTVLQISYWGYLVLLLAGFCVFGVALVYSRLANTYNDHYGGSYSFARHLDDDVANNRAIRSKNKWLDNLVFFVGWNQFIQSPLLAAIAPLFLADAVEIVIPHDYEYRTLIIWITRVVSILFFIGIVALSTIGLKTNKKIIALSSLGKWFILVLAIILMIIAIAQNGTLPHLNIDKDPKFNTIQPKLIISNTLLFMYAFSGIEDVSSMVKDVKFKNFRKILLISFACIFTFYLIFFTFFLFLPEELKILLVNSANLSTIYSYSLGLSGVILFIIGFLSNDLSFKLFQSVTTARRVVPLAEDTYFPKSLAKRNKNGEFKNAIVFSTVVILVSMVVLWIIPSFMDEQGSKEFFDGTIIGTTTALFIEDIITLNMAFALEKKKRIPKIPWLEKIVYIVTMIAIFFLLMLFYTPWVISDSWGIKNTVALVSYLAFVGFGFLLKKWYQYNISPKIRTKTLFRSQMYNPKPQKNAKKIYSHKHTRKHYHWNNHH